MQVIKNDEWDLLNATINQNFIIEYWTFFSLYWTIIRMCFSTLLFMWIFSGKYVNWNFQPLIRFQSSFPLQHVYNTVIKIEYSNSKLFSHFHLNNLLNVPSIAIVVFSIEINMCYLDHAFRPIPYLPISNCYSNDTPFYAYKYLHTADFTRNFFE